MKKILYLTVLLLIIVPFMNICDISSVQAQYWANESGSLWDLADKTGYYAIERCEYCQVFICANSREELPRNMHSHIVKMHYDEYLKDLKGDDEEAENNYDGGGSNDENLENNSSNNDNPEDSSSGSISDSNNTISVVDLNNAAYIMQQAGVDNSRNIIDNYEDSSYGYYIKYPYIPLYNFIRFITSQYGAYQTSLSSANNANMFIGLYPTDVQFIYGSQKLLTYNVSTSKYYYEYEYVYVFSY